MGDAATTTAPMAFDPPQPTSPLIILPAEIRIKIYELALQAMVTDPLRAALANRINLESQKVDQPKYRGALALLHTNRSIRAESAGEMLLVVRSKYEALAARCDRLGENGGPESRDKIRELVVVTYAKCIVGSLIVPLERGVRKLQEDYGLSER